MTKIQQYSLELIITAAIIIEGIGAASYFLTNEGVERELLAKAERDMKESQRVATVKAQVVTAVHNVLPIVTSSVKDPDKLMWLNARLIADNPNIMGAGIAFKPNYYKDKGKNGLYAPYTYDLNAANNLATGKREKPNVKSSPLTFNYMKREWFVRPMSSGKSYWTEPYVGEGGSNVMMCTYVEPVVVGGQPVGVFFADVPLRDVSILSQGIHSGFRRSGIIIFGLQLVSLLLMAFIIWRAVQASRRYKEQHVDPEKEHLADQLAKMKDVNNRLILRNQELAKKVADLQWRVANNPQQTDQHWFG